MKREKNYNKILKYGNRNILCRDNRLSQDFSEFLLELSLVIKLNILSTPKMN